MAIYTNFYNKIMCLLLAILIFDIWILKVNLEENWDINGYFIMELKNGSDSKGNVKNDINIWDKKNL